MRRFECLRGFLIVALVMGAGVRYAAQQMDSSALRPAVTVDAIGTILDAFRSHAVVALGEDHGNE
jgi:hypothetical protein